MGEGVLDEGRSGREGDECMLCYLFGEVLGLVCEEMGDCGKGGG